MARKHRRVVRVSEVDQQFGASDQESANPLAPRALPNRAAEDSNEGWGERADDDSHLTENVPPHWGKS